MVKTQPVYIKGDFVNRYFELTDDQLKAIITYAANMHDENNKEQPDGEIL